MKVRKRGCLVLMLMLLAAAAYHGWQYCSTPAEAAFRHSFFAMNTFIDVSIYGEAGPQAAALAEQRIRQLEELLSVTATASEIYAVNHSGGREILLSRDTAEVVRQALAAARDTGGAFDPTIYSLLKLWGFTTEHKAVPAAAALEAKLSAVGYDKVKMKGAKLFLPEGMQLDLGGIAKGYAGTEAAKALREQGITSALINLGGNVQTLGRKPDGSLWQIAVRDPWSEKYLGVLSVEDQAVVTSGDYERYFTGADGIKYGHILDPHTGFPARQGVAAVTVVGADGGVCDALATAFFVMGPERSAAWWRSGKGCEFLLVTEKQEVYVTEGLLKNLVLQPEFAAWPLKVVRR